LEAELRETGAVPGGETTEPGDAAAPIANDRDVAGETLVGTSHLLAVNGPDR
jgi:hypothetical protein